MFGLACFTLAYQPAQRCSDWQWPDGRYAGAIHGGQAAHVTMLQRSGTYIVSFPDVDVIACT